MPDRLPDNREHEDDEQNPWGGFTLKDPTGSSLNLEALKISGHELVEVYDAERRYTYFQIQKILKS